MKTIIKKLNLLNILLVFFVSVILFISLRGLSGNPNSSDLNSSIWKENGPFELSPERGRFALLYSIVEDKSLQFTPSIGKFAEPDVAVSKGRFVSLFAPLLSIIAIPGYFLGKLFGNSQVGAFTTISFFALINFILIKKILTSLNYSNVIGVISGIIFLFGTPAYAYGVNLYQHHISTFLILLSVYMLLRLEKIWSFLIIFFLCALAIPLDYPNLFFLFPLGMYAFIRLFDFEKLRNKIKLKINIFKIFTPLIMIFPIIFFLLFNFYSYGNAFQLSGTLQTVENLSKSKNFKSTSDLEKLSQEQVVKKSALGSFKSRSILNGFYILFISPDRGVLYYAPIIIFGIGGIVIAYKKKIKIFGVLMAILGANILLYSMWGDPWGGWAFGARYLIPSYAIMSIFVGILLGNFRKIILIIPFVLVGIYSIAVNTLGAITTSAMPPQVEVLNLEKITGVVQRYTYQRNWEFLLAGNSKSFIFQTFLNDRMTALQFYEILVGIIITIFTLLLVFFYASNKREVKNV